MADYVSQMFEDDSMAPSERGRCSVPGAGPRVPGMPGGQENPGGARGVTSVAPPPRQPPQEPRAIPEAREEAVDYQWQGWQEGRTDAVSAEASDSGWWQRSSAAENRSAPKARCLMEEEEVAKSGVADWRAPRPRSSQATAAGPWRALTEQGGHRAGRGWLPVAWGVLGGGGARVRGGPGEEPGRRVV